MNGSKRDKIPIPYPWSIILKIDYKITIVIYSSEPNQRKISTKSPTRRSFQTKFKVIQNEEPGQRFKSSTSKGNINSPRSYQSSSYTSKFGVVQRGFNQSQNSECLLSVPISSRGSSNRPRGPLRLVLC